MSSEQIKNHLNSEKVSVLSTIVNAILSLLKIGGGFLWKSSALMADGIHSGLDVISSFITYLGIRIAKKPPDTEHPYGHLRYETVAGFVVVFLLFLSALWIVYDGISALISGELYTFGWLSVTVAFLSVITNEFMSKLKFKVGEAESSLALIADAKHSRADSLSSVAVIIGLFLSIWLRQADAVAAILIGIYILYETWLLAREVTDNLVDKSDEEIEKAIREICNEEEIDLLDIRTRKIGAKSFAELKIGLNKSWRVEKVDEVVTNLEKVLIERIEGLGFVTIQIVSHDLRGSLIKTATGHRLYRCRKLKENGNSGNDNADEGEDEVYRIVVPVKEGKIYTNFGAPEYLVVDKEIGRDRVISKRIVKNPHFVLGRGHGMMFVREIKPNKVITRDIGENAKEELKSSGIEVEIVGSDFDINKFVGEI